MVELEEPVQITVTSSAEQRAAARRGMPNRRKSDVALNENGCYGVVVDAHGDDVPVLEIADDEVIASPASISSSTDTEAFVMLPLSGGSGGVQAKGSNALTAGMMSNEGAVVSTVVDPGEAFRSVL